MSCRLQRALARPTLAAMRPVAHVSFLALFAALASCKHAGEYVWVDQYAGVKPADVTTLAAAVGLSIAMALAGSVMPALRALRVDPLTAIRTE